MLAHGGSAVGRVLGCANSDTELLVRDERHPFLVVHVTAADVGSNVTTDRVSFAGSSVGVEFTSLVTLRDVELGQVSPTGDLDVGGRLDKVGGWSGRGQ